MVGKAFHVADVRKYLPKMHDAGILKKIGVMQRSRKVIAAITDGNEYIVDNNAELRDGKWYSDTIRMLEAGKRNFMLLIGCLFRSRQRM